MSVVIAILILGALAYFSYRRLAYRLSAQFRQSRALKHRPPPDLSKFSDPPRDNP